MSIQVHKCFKLTLSVCFDADPSISHVHKEIRKLKETTRLTKTATTENKTTNFKIESKIL